jgi:hypothetical protein
VFVSSLIGISFWLKESMAERPQQFWSVQEMQMVVHLLPESEVTLELNGKGMITCKLKPPSPVEKGHISDNLISAEKKSRK